MVSASNISMVPWRLCKTCDVRAVVVEALVLDFSGNVLYDNSAFYSNTITGADAVLVTATVFKTDWGARAVPGGFDSHTFPPSITSRHNHSV
jgi:hypothetical protein